MGVSKKIGLLPRKNLRSREIRCMKSKVWHKFSFQQLKFKLPLIKTKFYN